MSAKTHNSGERAAAALTSLDSALFEGAQATKRDLIDYLGEIRDLIRVRPGQATFVQKSVPA